MFNTQELNNTTNYKLTGSCKTLWIYILALYVYEYLLHVGAQKAAQTFLNEIRWEKNITLGEPPGFLHSWWCVFWDLYCAAPERRDTCDHSSEAKAFHDYGFVNSGYSVNGLPPHHPGNPMMAGGMPPRMTPPRGPGPMGGGPMGPYGMRGPPPGHMAPMGGRPPWPPNAAGMSPGGYPGPPSASSQPGSSTPIMPSPQDSNNSSGDNMYTLMKPAGAGNNMPGDMCGGPPSGPEVGGPLGGPGGGPGGPPGPPGNGGGNGNTMLNGDTLDNMKSSPAPGTPRGVEESGNLNEFGMGSGGGSFGGEVVKNDQNESAAIQKIKESMQEEAKRFEKDGEHSDYFMQ
ncbi:single-stranded DNA-binding protein 2 isoform X2 [Lepeophtheirus salmonis]|uniref:single-stranded DNA-binding protein 2 isoform X2 n=1 Tax=Lepeophtheirus salmonis TaxID=72036 RepID=UPI003AF38BC8